MKQTKAQILLGIHVKELKLGPVEYEHQFNHERRWRADLYLPEHRIILECDGGAFRGGHRRGKALEADYERQNWATASGYRLFRFTNEQVLKGEAKAWLAEHLAK